MKDHDDTGIHLSIRPNRDDRHHDQHLFRDLQAVNERTTWALGSLPFGGLPVQPKRKPQLPRPAAPPGTPTSAPSDEDTPMQWKNAAAVAALATGSALAACGAGGDTPTPVNPSSAVANEAPESVEMPPVKAVPQPAEDPETKRETTAQQLASEHERGPAIPAAKLRRQILELLGSFRTLEDLERESIERALKVRMHSDPETKNRYTYIAETTEGWTYWVDTSRMYGSRHPSATHIHFDHGVEPFTDQQPAYCTLEFEPLAKELVAMGYERDSRSYPAGRDISWGFGKSSADQNFGVGVEVLIYDIQIDKGRKMTCIEGFRIGGGVLDG